MDEPKQSETLRKPDLLGETPVEQQPDGKEEVADEYSGMMRVGAWARAFSWLILAVGGAYVLLNLFRFVSSVASAGSISQIPVNDLLSGILGVLYSILQVGFFVLVLQGISKIIDFLFDHWL